MFWKKIVHLLSCLTLAALLGGLLPLAQTSPVLADTASFLLASNSTSYTTLAEAISNAGTTDTITLSGTYTLTATATIPEGKAITLQGADASATIIRGSSFTAGAMITIGQSSTTSTATASLTLANIILDGAYSASSITVTYPIINVGTKGYPVLTINDGTILQYNHNTSTGNNTNSGGAVCTTNPNTVLTMNGGKISNNTSGNYGGGIFSYKGTFAMNGGEISNNSASNGGGIYFGGTAAQTPSVKINGGTIKDNTATTAGSAIAYSTQNTPLILGAPAISGTIYLNYAAGYTRVIYLTRALTSALTVQSATPSEGLVIAQGSDYTLTTSDLLKFSYNGSWYCYLDTANNAIKLTATPQYKVTADNVTGGSLAVSPSISASGTTITVTATPESGYQLLNGSLQYTTDNSTYTEITAGSSGYTFSLPAADTLVTARFEQAVNYYTITVDSSITGGTVAVSPDNGTAGSSITVTLTPDNSTRQYVEGSLKYSADNVTWTEITATDGVYGFILPAADVTVTARFVTYYEVTFRTDDYTTALVDNTSVTSSEIGEGIDLPFTVDIESGYELGGITATNGTVTASGGDNYTLSGVTGDSTITISASEPWEEADLTIYTAEELRDFAEAVNGGDNFTGKVVRLGADIDLKGTDWTPIGYHHSYTLKSDVMVHLVIDHSFGGVFDGDGYTVSGLSVDNTTVIDTGLSGYYLNESLYYNQGFFGYISGATIKNLTVEGSVSGTLDIGGVAGCAYNSDLINCVNRADVDGYNYIGGIAGNINGKGSAGLYGCANYGDILQDRESDTNLGAQGQYVGGIVGYTDAPIACCANFGAVSDTVGYSDAGNAAVGGIMGGSDTSTNTYSLDRCYNTGAISGNVFYVGGIIGKARDIDLSNCYNRGAVISTFASSTQKTPCYACGIIAEMVSVNYTSTLTNCYNTGTVTFEAAGYCTTGEIYGSISSSTATNNYTSTNTFSAEDLGSAYAEDSGNINDGYPVLAWQIIDPGYVITFDLDNGAAVTVKDSENQTQADNGTSGVYILSAGAYTYTVTNGSVYASGSFNVARGNKTLTVSLSSGSAVTFNLTPSGAGAAIAVKNSDNQTMADNGTAGCYSLLNGNYTYTVSASGYTTVTGSFVVAGLARTIPVSLVDSSLVYSVTVDSSISNGTIAVSPDNGTSGTAITVTVTPDKKYRLVSGSLTCGNSSLGYTVITSVDGVYSFSLPTDNVTISAEFEKIPTTSYNITKAAVPDDIWGVTLSGSTAMAEDTVTVKVSDTSNTSWSTGLVITGNTTGKTYDYTTVTQATGDSADANTAGTYSFSMPSENVTVGFTADYSLLKVYVKIGRQAKTLVHAYTRADMEDLAASNSSPIYYAMWDRLPAVFMGKAVRYVTLQELIDSAHTYNSSVRYDDEDCTMTGKSLDNWTTSLTWSYLLGTTRYYYASLGSLYTDNQTSNQVVQPALAITGWSGREEYVDSQSYDTANTYRFFYGLSASQYGTGVLPTTAEMDTRCTAHDSAKWVNQLVFEVPETYNVTADSAISGGNLSFSPDNGTEGTTITVSATPEGSNQLVSGSLKYTADNSSYTTIRATDGVYSFSLPAEDVIVTAKFGDASVSVTGVSLDKNTVSLTTGETTTLTATVTPANALYQNVTWTSDNESAATVDSEGVVTAAANGTATITVTTEQGSYSSSCLVTVSPPVAVSGVSLNKSVKTLTTGSVYQLTASVSPANAADQGVSWASDNTSAVTVSSSGLVRALKAGSAVITVTTDDGEYTDACTVTVKAAGTDHFTIAVLPDTQYYSESYPAIFENQTRWIADNADSQNIVFTAHLGDIINDYDNATQWQNAKNAMGILKDAGLPYSVVPGNHDLNFDEGDTANFDAAFPYTDFENNTWYGGHYPDTSNTSSYQLFSALGQDFIVLNLVSFNTLLDNATAWANEILNTYDDRPAIVVTHGYINADGEINSGNNTSGIAIFNNIVYGHSNVIAVLCGNDNGEYYNTSTGSDGHTIYNLLTDYSDQDNGGDGWLRLYQFYPDSNKVTAVTYSPYLDQYDTTTYGQFDLSLEMGGSSETPAWDLNDDGVCDSSDITAVTACWGQTGEDGWIPEDLNGDGVIDVCDLVMLGYHWGETW